MPISGGDGKVFVCVEYFAHKARLPGWCVDTNLTPQFSSTKEPVLQKNGEYIRLKNISRQQKQIFSEYLSVCAISGGIRGNGLNLVGRIFSTSYKKKEEGEVFCQQFIICTWKKMIPQTVQIFERPQIIFLKFYGCWYCRSIVPQKLCLGWANLGVTRFIA